MKLKTVVIIACMLVLISSVAGFTNCPSNADFEDAIRSAIVNYFANPSEENLNILKDLVEFYSTNDLSTADCSETGKNSDVKIQEIYDNAGKVSETVKEEVKGVIDVVLAVDGNNTYDRVLLVDDEPSSYSGRSGDYELRILDGNENVLWGKSFDLPYMYNETPSDSPFDMLGYKIPYNSSMRELRLYKKGSNIFSKQLSFCDYNGVCDNGFETHYSCPSDCSEPVLNKVTTNSVTGAVFVDGSSGVAYRKAMWSWQATFDYFVNIQYSDDKIHWNVASPCGHVRFRESMENQARTWSDVGAHKYWALHVCGTAGIPPFQIWEMDWLTYNGTGYVEDNPTADQISFEGPYTYFNAAKLIDNDLNTLGLQRDQPGTSEARLIISKTPPQPKLKILFVPLLWQGNQDSFVNAVNIQKDFWLSEITLRNCPEKVQFKLLDVNTQNFNNFRCNTDTYGADLIKPYVRNTLGIKEDYDIIFGLTNLTWPCGVNNPTAGWEVGDVLWGTTEDFSAFAHEMGHYFGLSEEYCSNPAGSTNPKCNDGHQWNWILPSWSPVLLYLPPSDINYLDADLGCNPNQGGGCCEIGWVRDFDHVLYKYPNCDGYFYGVCCKGNNIARGGEIGRSTMSYATDNPDPDHPTMRRGYDVNSLAYLATKKQLSCG